MDTLSSQIYVRNVFPQNRDETLKCDTLLRFVPGKREVWDALWNDKPVVVKLFFHKYHAKRHLRREWKGLNLLMGRNLTSLKPLFYGRTEEGRWAVVVEKIVDSQPALDVFEQLNEISKKLDLLRNICKELVRYHDKGVLQQDMHLGNFLLKGERVFLLDTGQMKFYSQPVSREKGIAQVALLGGFIQDKDKDSIKELCRYYLTERGYQPSKTDEALMISLRNKYREIAIRRGLKKALRTSKRYERIRGKGYRAVYEKLFFKDTDIKSLFNQLNALVVTGEILKNGNTCYVSTLNWNGKRMVVKRYNDKGIIHSLRHAIKTSRARRGWLHGHRLKMLGINTPKPLCYVELYKGYLVRKSFLITEFIEGKNLHDTLRDNEISESQLELVIHQVLEQVNRLHRHKIVHGDLKHSNIIISGKGPVLTDLDSLKMYRWDFLFNKQSKKDMKRLNIREKLDMPFEKR